jgi:hypothetical protein
MRLFLVTPFGRPISLHQIEGPLLIVGRIALRSRNMTSTASAAGRLAGKTVFITGASSGIGRSTAFEFARTSPKDLKLILAARRIESLHEIASQIRQEVGDGVKILPMQLDVSNPEEVRQFVPSLPDEFKDINILVNNASVDTNFSCYCVLKNPLSLFICCELTCFTVVLSGE